MRQCYLATEPSREASYSLQLLRVSGVTVNECARDSGLKSRSANNTGSMRFVSVVHDYRRRLNQSPFRPRAEVSFPRTRQFSEYNGKEASASMEIIRNKCCQTGHTVYPPYPRRLESLTVCRCHYEGNTFSSVSFLYSFLFLFSRNNVITGYGRLPFVIPFE